MLKSLDIHKATPEQLTAEVYRLRGALWSAGMCPECGDEIGHDIEAPFADCSCGTAEACQIPTIALLRWQLHLTSFCLFKLTDGGSIEDMGKTQYSTEEHKLAWIAQWEAVIRESDTYDDDRYWRLVLDISVKAKEAALWSPTTNHVDISYGLTRRFRAMGWIKVERKGLGGRQPLGWHPPGAIKRVPRPAKPRIICICGSSRFIRDVALKAWEFEKAGSIVLGMHLLPPNYPADHAAESEGIEVAKALDELHLRKIDLCDDVYVMNVNGYIGERTRIEIDYAHSIGKPVDYLNPGLAGR